MAFQFYRGWAQDPNAQPRVVGAASGQRYQVAHRVRTSSGHTAISPVDPAGFSFPMQVIAPKYLGEFLAYEILFSADNGTTWRLGYSGLQREQSFEAYVSTWQLINPTRIVGAPLIAITPDIFVNGQITLFGLANDDVGEVLIEAQRGSSMVAPELYGNFSAQFNGHYAGIQGNGSLNRRGDTSRGLVEYGPLGTSDNTLNCNVLPNEWGVFTLRLEDTAPAVGATFTLTRSRGIPQSTVAGATDLTLGQRTTSTLVIESSTGLDVVIPSATSSLAGLLSASDKSKLDGLGGPTGPVAPHTHAISDTTGLQAALDSKLDDTQAGTLGLALLDDATPTEGRQTLGLGSAATASSSDFAAAVHGHSIGNISGLQGALDGKANSLHGHSIADVSGLTSALDSKLDDTQAGTLGLALLDDATPTEGRQTLGLGSAATASSSDFAAAVHGHSIGNVSGLQGALDGKAEAGHNHQVADVVGFQTALDGKANTSHTHAISDTTGLQAALDSKLDDTQAGTLGLALLDDATPTEGRQTLGLGSAATASTSDFAAAVHGHSIGNVSGLQGALDGKANSLHGHSIADTAGLQAALDSKLDDTQASVLGLELLGSASQALARNSLGLGSASLANATDFAPASHGHTGFAPAGGNVGQVLKKISSASYDYDWQDDLQGSGGVTDGDKGDITVSAGIWTIDSNVVSNAKLDIVPSLSFKGRSSAGSGNVQDLTATEARQILNVQNGATANSADEVLLSRANHTGSQLAATISDFQTAVDARIVANPGVGRAPTGGTTGQVLKKISGTDYDYTWQFPVTDGDKGDITTSSSGSNWIINAGAVGLSKLANIAQGFFIGRQSVGSGAPEALSVAQVTALLDNFTSTLKGLVPASGGGSTNFLRADGTWAAPPSGGSGLATLPYRASGTYFSPEVWVTGASTTTSNFTASTLRAVAFRVDTTSTFTRVWTSIATAVAGVNYRIGIYNSGTGGYPSTLVAGSDVQEYSFTTTGVVEGTFATPITLTPGWYWIVTNMSAAPGTGAIRGFAVGSILPISANPSSSNVVPFSFLQVGQTYGPMPTTFPAGASPQVHSTALQLVKTLLRYQ